MLVTVNPPPQQSEAHSPHVYRCGVLRGAQQHIRRSVPKRYHLVRVGLSRHGLGPRQAWGAETWRNNQEDPTNMIIGLKGVQPKNV